MHVINSIGFLTPQRALFSTVRGVCVLVRAESSKGDASGNDAEFKQQYKRPAVVVQVDSRFAPTVCCLMSEELKKQPGVGSPDVRF